MNSGLLEDLRRNPVALGMAIALHLLILGAAVFSFSFRQTADLPAAENPVNIVKAEAIDARDFDKTLDRHKQAEDKKQRQAQDAKRKKDEARLKAEQAKKQKAEEQKRIALQKKQEADKQKKAAEAKRQEEKKRKAEQAKKQKAEERSKAEAKAEQERISAILAAEEAELKEQERLAAERREAAARAERERQQAVYNSQLAQMKVSYIGAIQSHVTAHWRRPPGTNPNDKAEVIITQAPGGYIISVRVESCTGSAAFCKAVEAAVMRSEPLPQPKDKALFDRDIRFTFRP